MRDSKEGIALAAIAAKETIEGTWRGTGGGIGISSGGLGLFVGGMTGTKTDRTLRAKEFRRPSRAEFNWWNVYGVAIIIIISAVLISLVPTIIDIIAPISKARPLLLDDVARIIGHWGGLIILFVGVGVFLIGSGGRQRAEEQRLEKARKMDATRDAVYFRLRYVEVDHVVFDPKSGVEIPATYEAIEDLIARLSIEEK